MLAPVLVLIEMVSYVTQVISFGLRLAANISAGHLLFAILSGLLLICYRMVLLFPHVHYGIYNVIR